jgi:hypothetical protein
MILMAYYDTNLVALQITFRLGPESDVVLEMRSGRANLNNFLSGNSGHKVWPWTAEQTGVFDGEEVSAPHPAHTHARFQGTGEV